MAKSKKAKPKKRVSRPTQLDPFKTGDVDVVNTFIETPAGSRNKFKYDEKLGFFALSGVLPEGMVFPHAFGFIPGTRAADGDPEDVLILMDEPTFTGCVVPSRLIGVIEAEQREKNGKRERNDRLIAVAALSRDYTDLHHIDDLNDNMMREIEQFFINYNKERGKKFKVLGKRGPGQAMRLLKKSIQQ